MNTSIAIWGQLVNRPQVVSKEDWIPAFAKAPLALNRKARGGMTERRRGMTGPGGETGFPPARE